MSASRESSTNWISLDLKGAELCQTRRQVKRTLLSFNANQLRRWHTKTRSGRSTMKISSRRESKKYSSPIFSMNTASPNISDCARRQLRGLRVLWKYGHFHVARLVASYELDKNWRSCTNEELAKLIEHITVDPSFLDAHYDRSLAHLVNIVERLTGGDLSRVINVFKSARVEEELDGVIATPKRDA